MINTIYQWLFPHTITDKYNKSVNRLLDYCIALLEKRFLDRDPEKIKASLSYLSKPEIRNKTATLFRQRNIQKVKGNICEESGIIYLEIIGVNNSVIPEKTYCFKFWPCDICPCVTVHRVYLQ